MGIFDEAEELPFLLEMCKLEAVNIAKRKRNLGSGLPPPSPRKTVVWKCMPQRYLRIKWKAKAVGQEGGVRISKVSDLVKQVALLTGTPFSPCPLSRGLGNPQDLPS